MWGEWMKKGMNFVKGFISFSEGCVRLLLFLTVGLLFGMSIFRTSVVSGYEEHTDYLVDSLGSHLGVLAGLVVIIILLKVCQLAKKHKTSNLPCKQNHKLLKWCFYVSFAGNLCLAWYWVLHTQLKPLGDAQILWNIAKEMLDGNYSSFQYLGYGERHFNQTGTLFFLKWLMGIVGYENQLVLQFINVGALGLLQFFQMKIAKELFKETVGYSTGILCILFFPVSLYVVFTYSNLLSWALIAGAFYGELRFLNTGKKRFCLPMAGMLIAAVLLKSFSWIALIAMGIVAVYACLDSIASPKTALASAKENTQRIPEEQESNSLFLLGMIVVSLVLILCCNQLMNHIISQKTGESKRRTMPAHGYVAMGMQESYMAPGWYNGIHDVTYLESEGIKEVMIPVFQDMIAYRIEEFKQNPGYMAWFYYHKAASQWNNPSFQGFWFGEISEAQTTVPQWITSIYQGELRGKLDWYLNELHMLILLGILLCLCLNRKKMWIKELLPGIYFFGGFLFLLFWEAKCQYTLGFFLALLPYSAAGYYALFKRMISKQ